VIVMRAGRNARTTIDAVKRKLESLKPGLPAGVEIVPTYDRSELIDRAVTNLQEKLVEEFIVVALVCFAFLFHLRSALVAVVALPLGVLAAFGVMHAQGHHANIMSLGGIAIAIGAHGRCGDRDDRECAQKIGGGRRRAAGGRKRGTLEGNRRGGGGSGAGAFLQPAGDHALVRADLHARGAEGRLFSPLAFTKTYAMAAPPGLSVTLVPVLMGYLIRGRIPREDSNPLQPRAQSPCIAPCWKAC
jgi:Cu(I)/Ag(I) efflux system membrane protein CusA/SilA